MPDPVTSRRTAVQHSEGGAVPPTGILLGCIAAVAIALIGFVLTLHPDSGPDHATTVAATAPPSPTASPTATTKAKKRPAVKRHKINVVVFNNSNIKGLAARTAATAHRRGWQVVGQDNWYGTITASTVYYPPALQRAARLLARDLNIHRVMPAVTPMQTDRLTVILTADYSAS
jgi:hypothetical protein